MGLKKIEGKKLFLYEAFLVVVSAAILGTFTGFMTAFILSAQFFLFIELPIQIVFPWLTLFIVLILSFTTTYFAVHYPVKQVNEKRIAIVLKQGDN